MSKKFCEYSVGDFLDDACFCEWALGNRPGLDEDYRKLLHENPDRKELFEEAYTIVSSLLDEKVKVGTARKKELWDSIQKNYRKQQRKIRIIRGLKYAAAVIPFVMLVSVAVYTYYSTRDDFKKVTGAMGPQNFAETKLLLEDGREIKIQEQTSEIVFEEGASTVKVNDRQICLSGQKDKAVLNQLIVPFGKKSKIVLSDNSVVWLNAGSRLIYPTLFPEKKRVVWLEGEAYFEVAKNADKPFFVETSRSKIRVLGTCFNVKAYADEPTEETVLAEGSVSLELREGISRKGILLKPEQRIVVSNEDNSYSLSNVNIQDYISWINGMFIFHNEPLSLVLKRISRYYNIEINWRQKLETRIISGKLDLKEDSKKVLDALALISDGKYNNINGKIYFRLEE